MKEKIKARIEQLKRQREQLFAQIAAHNGAIAELSLLLEPGDDNDAAEDGPGRRTQPEREGDAGGDNDHAE